MDESRRVAKIVLILGAAVGLALVFITPPFQVPDEDAHFFRAYQASTINLRLEKRSKYVVGAYLPRSYLHTQLLFRSLTLDRDARVHVSMYKSALCMRDSKSAFCSPILPYPPVAHIAQAIGMFAGRSAGTPPIVSLYIARILNLALFLFMVTFAIRLMPVLPWGMGFLFILDLSILV